MERDRERERERRLLQLRLRHALFIEEDKREKAVRGVSLWKVHEILGKASRIVIEKENHCLFKKRGKRIGLEEI